MTAPDPPESEGLPPASLEWQREVPLTSSGFATIASHAGFVVGLAIVILGFIWAMVLRSESRGIPVRWPILGAMALLILGGGLFGMIRRRSSPLGSGRSLPVQFVVHELGAEAIAETPSVATATLLQIQLQHHGTSPATRAFLTGLAKLFRRSGEPLDCVRVAVDWGEVGGATADASGHWIDLHGRDAPGLRLSCTPVNFGAVRRLVGGHVPLRARADPPGHGTESSRRL